MAESISGDGPLPADGRLPETASAGSRQRNFGVYVHVPFCRVRCGYCDFNTYTAVELGETKQSDYSALASNEVEFAAKALRASGVAEREVQTVFFGGGTPTQLPAKDLISLLSAIQESWSLAAEAEITTEANPDSVDAAYMEQLRAAGFNRISLGMQSAVPKILEVLDRTHDAKNVPLVARAARELDFELSLDLMYGSPLETLDDFKRSLDAALECEPTHISAYSLIVEPGTKLAAQIRRGDLPTPNQDLQAQMYEYADALLRQEGFSWYEVSNWARGEKHVSRHNLSYWQGADWWGVGPGAHSHVGGVRWWNVKHPAAYAARITEGVSPAQDHEVLSAESVQLENVLLGIRLAAGLPIELLSAAARERVAELIADELVDAQLAFAGTLRLTLRGRLLADAVVRKITD